MMGFRFRSRSQSSWGKVSGPGNISVTDPNSPTTIATFDAPGAYVLRLTANDSALTAFDEVTITVNPPSGDNQPPTVSAGPNQTIMLGANLVVNPGSG